MVSVATAEEDAHVTTREDSVMTHAKAVEYRITRKLLQRHSPSCGRGKRSLAEHLIAALSGLAVLLLLGPYLQELLWALIAAGVVLSLGITDS